HVLPACLEIAPFTVQHSTDSLATAGTAAAAFGLASPYLASDDLTPADQRTEASTWINTACAPAGASPGGARSDS
ncbi:MAG TPA: hypothetical protein VGD71_12780, partial [Kribbella sp.]